MSKKYEIDMCNGPLFGKILMFSLPLIASGILQLLFNAADMVVAGRYAGSVALAAVGSTSSLINLLINLFIGLSVGANVAVAHFYGAKQEKDLSETVHTTMCISLIGGFILFFVGILFSEPLLAMMGTPEDVLSHSVAYMKIYFIGMPVVCIYNFGSAILRAVGDTKRPMYFLLVAGIINVILNLIFVIQFDMGVRGVAWATTISQTISATLVVICLLKTEGATRLEFKKLKIHKDKLGRILRVGLPAGLQGCIFSISNVLIQSSVNTFGSIAVAGNTACCNLEGFIYTTMNSFYQTAISFVGQNMGAKKLDRIKKTMFICMGCVVVAGLSMGLVGMAFGKQLLSIYSSDPEVISFGFRRMVIIFSTYFTCGLMDTMVGVQRGMGNSILPMIVSIIGVCGFRIVWIFTFFRMTPTPENLYLSYPISWTATFLVHVLCLAVISFPKVRKSMERIA